MKNQSNQSRHQRIRLIAPIAACLFTVQGKAQTPFSRKVTWPSWSKDAARMAALVRRFLPGRVMYTQYGGQDGNASDYPGQPSFLVTTAPQRSTLPLLLAAVALLIIGKKQALGSRARFFRIAR